MERHSAACTVLVLVLVLVLNSTQRQTGYPTRLTDPSQRSSLPVRNPQPLQSFVSPQASRSSKTAELALLAVCVIWGLNFSVMKLGLGELHPLGFNAIRLTISAVLLGAFHFASRARSQTLPKGSWKAIIGLSVLGYFGYQVVFMAGLARTASGNAALLLASAPAFTFVIARLFGDHPTARAWLGMLVAFAGTASIAWTREIDRGSDLLLGNVLVLLAAIAWGTFTFLNTNLAKTVAPASLAFLCTICVLPLHWALGAAHLQPLFDGMLSSRTWWTLLYSGALGTGLAVILFNIGLRGAGPSYTAGLISLVPVMAVFIGYLWLGEPLRGLQILGGACVLGGVWLIRTGRRPTAGKTNSGPAPQASAGPNARL